MDKKLDLSLYLILDPILCGGIDGMLETTAIAIKHGVTIVQLRSEQELSRRKWYESAKALQSLLANTPVPLIINDMVDIALAVDADGVHVGQSDLPADVTRKLIGEDKFLGLSVSNQKQMASVSWCTVDYVGIGPIFKTTTKADAAPNLGLKNLADLTKICQKPAVAIGGINRSNTKEVLLCGVDGIAVISAICGQHDIADATAQLDSIIKNSKNRR
ncbi:thiamine phosphate synthase [Orbaceae bacterium ESL0721]|nr:thiamine phosphate synthase [Orbaceae bacterium ESL0721]